MKHIKTLTNRTLENTMKKGGCGTVGNQKCENVANR